MPTVAPPASPRSTRACTSSSPAIPGTGKTTVARIIARLYGSIGLVSRGHLVEVSRADLVAGYVGQTALKVQAVVDRGDRRRRCSSTRPTRSRRRARGEFGAEAVGQLVKLMEDHRDDLAVIVAGYPDEMRQFIDSNPGLRSRFTHYIDFPDYTAAELVEVFEGFAAEAKVGLGEGVPERLGHLFVAALEVGNFGNARYARTMFEGAYANMATRALADGLIEPPEVEHILVEDLPTTDPCRIHEAQDRLPPSLIRRLTGRIRRPCPTSVGRGGSSGQPPWTRVANRRYVSCATRRHRDWPLGPSPRS